MLNEATNKLEKISFETINEDNLHQLMRYFDVLDDLKKIEETSTNE